MVNQLERTSLSNKHWRVHIADYKACEALINQNWILFSGAPFHIPLTKAMVTKIRTNDVFVRISQFVRIYKFIISYDLLTAAIQVARSTWGILEKMRCFSVALCATHGTLKHGCRSGGIYSPTMFLVGDVVYYHPPIFCDQKEINWTITTTTIII